MRWAACVSSVRRVHTGSGLTLTHAIEGTVLVCVGLLPLAIMPESAMMGFIQVPKMFVLRSIALVLAVLLALEWARTDDRRALLDELRELPSAMRRYLGAQPIVLAASAVLADGGADVIKVEHAERGDARRGLGRSGGMELSQ